MAKAKAAARGDTLAGEAWAAGCRDVQAAINWAAGRGEDAGAPFQAAFRRVKAAQEAAPAAVSPPAPPMDPGAAPAGDRRKRARQEGPGPARPVETSAGKGSARPKAAKNGRAEGEPAPTRGATGEPKSGTPAEFVEDMRMLRHLVTKYGKKGLADLMSMIGG